MSLLDRAAMNIRIPHDLKARIDAAAKAKGIPVNAYLTVLLDENVPTLPKRRRKP
jgi:predicted HicB family RNase H-like nuclease